MPIGPESGERGMQGRLEGRAIIVVGSATGIGAATVRRLVSEGARVCAADINIAGARALAEELAAGGADVFAAEIDIAGEASVDRAVAAAAERFGGLDGAHVNAADLSVVREDSDALAEDLAVFDRTIAVNLRGHLLCTRAVLPHFLKRGQGAIVYTSSGAADFGSTTRPAYACSKAGLQALMRHVAARWGREGVTANCVAPGPTDTPEKATNGRWSPAMRASLQEQVPHRRLGWVDDLAAVVAMLLSKDGEWVNGQVYQVNGGHLMR